MRFVQARGKYDAQVQVGVVALMSNKLSSLERIAARCDATGVRNSCTDQVPPMSEKRGRMVSVRVAPSMRLQFTTSAGNAAPLKKRRLFSTFFVNTRLSLGVDIGYLAHHFFSACRSYHLLISRI